jgi:hypothetical protein
MHRPSLIFTVAAFVLGLLSPLALTPAVHAQQPQCTGSFTIDDSIAQDQFFTQMGRLTQNGVTSNCASQKNFPGVEDTNQRRFKMYQFVNNNTSTACITVTLNAKTCTGALALFSAAYTGFNPFDLSMNYLADMGRNPNPLRSYSFNVPAGADFQVIVNPVNVNQSCPAYTLTVEGFGCLPPGEMIISEFRFGVESTRPNARQDEYIELYNNTDAPLTVTTTDGSDGWALVAGDGVTRFVIPKNTIIPARGHYLGVNSTGYSLGGYPAGSGTTATGDATYTQDIPQTSGVALFRTADPAQFTLANRIDAVGFTSASPLYRENGINSFPVSSSGSSYFHVRRMNSGLPQDTGDNMNDFAIVTQGFDSSSTLGAPGPENLASPIQRNRMVKASPLDSSVTSTVSPNRERNATAVEHGSLGTLTLRRSFRNNTGVKITRLRFRVVDITTRFSTLNGPQPGQADLRVVDSTPEIVAVSGGSVGNPPVSVTVQGVKLEKPPEQFSGGGLNSSVACCVRPESGAPAGTRTVSLEEPLAAGDTVHIQFRLGVEREGNFRFFVNVEAETDAPPVDTRRRQLKSPRTKAGR